MKNTFKITMTILSLALAGCVSNYEEGEDDSAPNVSAEIAAIKSSKSAGECMRTLESNKAPGLNGDKPRKSRSWSSNGIDMSDIEAAARKADN